MSDNITSKCIIHCDLHTHTGFSDDCDIPMEEMLEAAMAKGIKTLAVTDHYDPRLSRPRISLPHRLR